MAYTTGTATGHIDLMDKVRAFVSDSVQLGSQAWTVKRWDNVTGELIMMGPGLTGQDQIYVGIKAWQDVAADWYNWRLNGYIGYDQAQTWEGQPGTLYSSLSSYFPQVALWNDSIPYWIVANGRRIIVVAKISNRYEACYLGLIQPYGSSGQFPYPLLIGGSMTGFSSSYVYNSTTYYVNDYRWSSDKGNHRHFVNPGTNSVTGGDNITETTNSACKLRKIDGTWLPIWNYDNTNISYHTFSLTSSRWGQTWPWFCEPPKQTGLCLDGSVPLFPIMITDNSPNVYGEFDGCYWVPGIGNSAENIITIGSDQYLAIPNVYRTAPEEFWALKLA